MVLPAGVTTVILTFGPYINELGEALTGEITIRGINRLWDPPGSVFYSTGVTKELDSDGAAIFFLPATDQDGYTDGDGNEIVNWSYTVSIRIADPMVRIYKIQLPAEGAENVTFDFDTLVPVPPS